MTMLRRCLPLVLAAIIPAAAPLGVMPVGRPEAPAAGEPRTDHALGVYDARLRRVVLIGGAGDPEPGLRDRVWSWSGTRWDLVLDAGPPGRVNAGAAYDVRREKVIVAGGSRKRSGSSGWEVVGDSWEGDSNGWRPIVDIAPRDHQALVENGRSGVLMFGGMPADRSRPWPADTWELHGAGWTRVATEGPGARGRAALAYDGKRRQVVLFGGVSPPAGPDGQQVFLDDTWIWEGRRWTRAAVSGPPGRYAHGMAFDERAGVVLLYGGAAAHRDAPLSDMWASNTSASWSPMRMTGFNAVIGS